MQIEDLHEGFPPWWTMLSVDFLLIVLAGIGTLVVVTMWSALRKAHATVGVALILIGFWVGVSLYIADIYAMTILPGTVGMAEAMAAMRALHLHYSWYVNTVCAVFILVGLILTVMQFVRQINVVEANREALEDSENLLESVFQNVPVGLLIKDSKNIVERPNQTYLDWYGLDAVEMLGQPSHEIENFQPPQDIEVMKGQEREVLESGKTQTRQVEREFADGQCHIVRITKFPVHDKKGEITKVGSVSVDLTELVAATQRAEAARKEAEAANCAKSAFLANMSHELRTPLNAIIGFSEAMLAQLFGPLGSEKYHAHAKAIQQSGHHLLDVVNDILEMAKIESKAYELSPEPFHLNEIVADSLQIVQVIADRNRVALEKQLPAAGLLITADKRALRQMLLNLVSNAVKFTASGGSVVVSATAAKNDLTLCVKDNGIGIPAEDIPKLTRPFNQGSRNQAYVAGEGTGLGLSIVAALVQLHHGTFDIRSEVGKGTEVSVFLPGVLCNAEQPQIA